MCNNGLTIRRAAVAEAALLANLGARTFSQAFGELTPPADLAAYLAAAFTVEQLSTELADARSTFLLAFDQDELAGYAKLYAGEAPACVVNKPAIELVRLYSLKNWWGHGVGAALMAQCLNMARQEGYAAIWLSSWQINHRANAFYHRWQFKVVGEKTFVVGADTQQDFVMACVL
jgi:diamine N-acetyltransferase